MAVYEVTLDDGSVYEIETEDDDFIDKVTGMTPQEMAEKGHWVASGLQQTAKDIFTIPANFFNQLSLNSLRSLGNTTGWKLPTEAQSGVAQGLNKAAGVAGMIMSPIAKLGMGVAKAPVTLANLAKLAGAGAMGGAAYAPNENFFDLGQRATQGIVGGILAPAGKLAGEGAKRLPGVIKNAPNNIFRGGLNKSEAIRIENEYGASNGAMVEKIKDKIFNLAKQADDFYQKTLSSFKGNTINSDKFFNTLKKGLRDKGWIDLEGNPTTRFQSGLDPVTDKLTNLFLDLKNAPTKAGKKVAGHVLSKADFSTYRDALGSMLRDRPSDRLVMSARNALYDSAEKSGMTGIKAARDLERKVKFIQKRYIDSKGDLRIATEAKLNKIGTDKPLSQQEMRHIQQLQKYVNHPIISDAAKINKLNAAKSRLLKIKERAIWGGVGAMAGAAGVGAVNRALKSR